MGPGAGRSPSRALAVPKRSDSASTCVIDSLPPRIRAAGRSLLTPRPPRQVPAPASRSPGTRGGPQRCLHSWLLSLTPQAPRSLRQIPSLGFPLTGGQKIGGARPTEGSGHERPPRGLFQWRSGCSNRAARMRISGVQPRVGTGWRGRVKWEVGASALGVTTVCTGERGESTPR